MGAEVPDDSIQVTYSLTSRLMVSGGVSIVMHLHRDGQHVLTTTLMTCDREDLPASLRKCRDHLQKLGVREVPRMPSAASL